MSGPGLRVDEPLGAILAGGRGRRIGGAKACVALAGRPLLAWPLAALSAVLTRVCVVAKADSELPELPHGVARYDEPDRPRHPIVGIVEALRRARGGPVLVCAVDLPLVDGALVARLARADAGGAPALLAAPAGDAGALQPLLGRYEAAALPFLEGAPDGAPLRATVTALGPALLPVGPEQLLNVNDEHDRRAAERALERSVR